MIRKIPGYPGYFVSESGQIYSAITQWNFRRLRLTPNKLGYLYVRIKNSRGDFRRLSVHQAVLFAWSGPRPGQTHLTRHLDGTPSNNHYTNLAWGTAKENSSDIVMPGMRAPLHSGPPPIRAFGVSHYIKKLSESDIRYIKSELSKPFEKGLQKDLARYFGVSTVAIHKIKVGKSWTSIF